MSIKKKYLRKIRYHILMYKRKKIFNIENSHPIVSFTFDDFPISAKINGAKILNNYGLKGTYYTSLIKMNKNTETLPFGEPFFNLEDLVELDQNGHEIGCHTFDHFSAENVSFHSYLQSILRNQKFFNKYFPNKKLNAFSYPYGGITIRSANLVGNLFLSSRTIWSGINKGTIELSLLKANQLSEKRSIDDCKKLIVKNQILGGWLIFVLHDVKDNPSRFGCTPENFNSLVNYAIESGAKIKSIGKTLESFGINK